MIQLSARMACRRGVVVVLVLLSTLGLGGLLLQVLAPGGWTIAKLTMFAAFLGTAPWTGLSFANGLIGFTILMTRRDAGWAGFRVPLDGGRGLPRTAIVLTVRNEDMRGVLPPLRRLLHELDLFEVGTAFTVFILSDTEGGPAAFAERRAVAAFRANDRDPARIRYRRRARNVGFKAGNIMDFLDHQGAEFELMLPLDADSEMSAAAVLRLVRAMQADPALAIAQHLTVGSPASAAFPRLFQFGMRAGMRVWATGQAWWQGDEGAYWGHNAAVRIAPFRAHCRLPTLPDGRHILSHDQLEAAMLCGAGWRVRVLLDEDGSWEVNPPALPEFLRRELRWLEGNLQYRHLLRLPGLRPMGRWQLLQAILLFAGAPLYLLFLLAAAVAAGTDATSPFPIAPAVGLTVAWLGAVHAPKLLGYAEVALSPAMREQYGGLARFAVGAAAEVVFALLLDAVSAVAKTGAMLRLARESRPNWLPQNRNDRGVSWGEAVRLYWPQTLLGALALSGFVPAGWIATLWASGLAAGLLLAIPLGVLTADPRTGRWLRERQIAAIPEEHPARSPGRAVSAMALQPQSEAD
jgi:membrane glycosyltransferase